MIPQLGDRGIITDGSTVIKANYAVFLIRKYGLAGKLAQPDAIFSPLKPPKPIGSEAFRIE